MFRHDSGRYAPGFSFSSVSQQMASLATGSKAFDGLNLLVNSKSPWHFKLFIINEIYTDKLVNIPEVVTFLRSISSLLEDPQEDLAALGAEALYELMDAKNLLDVTEMLCLHTLCNELVTKLNHSASSGRSKHATLFRACGLVMATQVHADAIYDRWTQVLLRGGYPAECWDAARTFPEDVDISRLVRQGYSGKVADSLKMLEFIDSLRPNYRLVVRGLKELLVVMYNLSFEVDQVDTYEFMDVVQTFKQVVKDSNGELDSEVVESVKSVIPKRIRNLFFLPSGYSVMYSRATAGFVKNYRAITVLSKQLEQECRLKVSSSWKPGYGTIFKIVDSAGVGLQPGYRWSVPISALFSSACDTALHHYKIRPYKRGKFFVVINVESGSGLVAALDFMGNGYVGKKECYNSDEEQSEPKGLWEFVDYDEVKINKL